MLTNTVYNFESDLKYIRVKKNKLKKRMKKSIKMDFLNNITTSECDEITRKFLDEYCPEHKIVYNDIDRSLCQHDHIINSDGSIFVDTASIEEIIERTFRNENIENKFILGDIRCLPHNCKFEDMLNSIEGNEKYCFYCDSQENIERISREGFSSEHDGVIISWSIFSSAKGKSLDSKFLFCAIKLGNVDKETALFDSKKIIPVATFSTYESDNVEELNL